MSTPRLEAVILAMVRNPFKSPEAAMAGTMGVNMADMDIRMRFHTEVPCPAPAWMSLLAAGVFPADIFPAGVFPASICLHTAS